MHILIYLNIFPFLLFLQRIMSNYIIKRNTIFLVRHVSSQYRNNCEINLHLVRVQKQMQIGTIYLLEFTDN